MKINELLNDTVVNLHRTKQILRESSHDSHDNDYVIIDLLNQIITLMKVRIDSEKSLSEPSNE